MSDDLLASCGDGSCILRDGPVRGMQTNGGCQHLKERGPQLNALLRALGVEVVRLRKLPVIDRCSLCSWAHCDTPTDGVCTHPDTLPRCAPIDPTKPPIDACPLRGGR